MNLDKKKLRLEINAVNTYRQAKREAIYPIDAGIKGNSPEWAPAYKAYRKEQARFSAERATRLYSLMAHSRGNLHVCKRWVATMAADGGLRLETRTMADQEQLIQPLLTEFTATEPESIAEPVQAQA